MLTEYDELLEIEDDVKIEETPKSKLYKMSDEHYAKVMENLAKGRMGHKKKVAGSCDLTVTPIFMRNKEATSLIVANRGGARSSKSYSIAQVILERFFSSPKRQIFVVRKTLPSLRVTALKLMYELLESMKLKKLVKEERIALNWKCPVNGSLIHFGSIDDPEKIKSSEYNDIWMEEATEFTYEDFGVLKTRLSAPKHDDIPNQLFMSFNPEDEHHWIKEKIIDGPEDCTEITSSYRDNPFLSEEYKKILEDLVLQDMNFYRIYTLGEWGKLENLIYSNWNTVTDIPEDTQADQIFYGLDFAFNSPSALIKIVTKNKEIYTEELLYETKLTNSDLAEKMRELLPPGHRRNCKIYCDSAEPGRIEELKREGFHALPAKKTSNSVKDGIDFIKRKKVHVLKTSSNLLKELRTYSWKKDKKTNNILDIPVPFNNHLLDALRYAVWTHLGGAGGPRVRAL